MRKYSIFLFCAMLAIASCQKEVADTAPKPNGSGLLRKQVHTNLADNIEYGVYEFEYDSSDRLIKRLYSLKRQNSTGSLQQVEGTVLFHRDITGRITSIEYPISTLFPDGITTLVKYEDPLSDKIVSVYDNQGKSKTLFSYNAAGYVEKLSFYQHFPQPSDPMKMVSYHVQTYDNAGNLLEKKFFQDDDNNGTFESPIRFVFEYDDKNNPLYPLDDVMAAEAWSLASPNNTVKQLNIKPGPPLPGDIITYVYEYDSDNRPVKCIKDQDSLNVVTYFYD